MQCCNRRKRLVHSIPSNLNLNSTKSVWEWNTKYSSMVLQHAQVVSSAWSYCNELWKAKLKFLPILTNYRTARCSTSSSSSFYVKKLRIEAILLNVIRTTESFYIFPAMTETLSALRQPIIKQAKSLFWMICAIAILIFIKCGFIKLRRVKYTYAQLLNMSERTLRKSW